MKLLKQRNNLRIFFIADNTWQVFSPDDRILEEFTSYTKALNFCNNTKDFIRK